MFANANGLAIIKLSPIPTIVTPLVGVLVEAPKVATLASQTAQLV